MTKVSFSGSAVVCMDSYFGKVLAALNQFQNKCPVCEHWFVSRGTMLSNMIFLAHVIGCGRGEKEVTISGGWDLFSEAARIEVLMGLRSSGRYFGDPRIGMVAKRILARTEPLGRCPDPCCK